MIQILIPISAKVENLDVNELKNKKHFAVMNPLIENIAEKAIKKTLKKKLGKGKYKVRFEGYTLKSLKKGIFKNLEIQGKNLEINGIPISYLNLKSLTDYNWVDYRINPVEVKSDIIFAYNLGLTEDSINRALQHNSFRKNIEKINKRAYPLFTMHSVDIKIKNDKLYVIIEYSLPLNINHRKRTFIVATKLTVKNSKIQATEISFDKSYGNLPLEKVANLINLIDPLTFTLVQLNEKDCKSQVENVIIKDDILKVNGKIYIMGE